MTRGIAEKRLLLVDDDGPLRTAIARGLRQLGYAVTEADDGLEAVRQVKAHPCGYFDACILDYSMWGLTGGEAANLMRECCPDQPVLFLSGHELPPDMRHGEATLQKPAMIEEIVEAVERLTRSLADTIPPEEP